MSGIIPTVEDIRAMDGLALTELAHRLGLAPDMVMTVCDEPTEEFRGCWYHNANGEPLSPWEPEERLATADAVFRALRVRGWKTIVVGGPDCGEVFAERLSCGLPRHVSVAWDTQEGEPLALLRCAVLAVASEQEPPPCP